MIKITEQTEKYSLGLVRCMISMTRHIGCDFGIAGNEKYCIKAIDKFERTLRKEYGPKNAWLNRSLDERASQITIETLLDTTKVFFLNGLFGSTFDGFIEPVKYAKVGEHYRDDDGHYYYETKEFPRKKLVESHQIDKLLNEIEHFYNRQLGIPTKVIRQTEDMPRSKTGRVIGNYRKGDHCLSILDFLTGAERKTISFRSEGDDSKLDDFSRENRRYDKNDAGFFLVVKYLMNRYPDARIII